MMKRIFILSIITFLLGYKANAQITSICATSDSIQLKASNHLIGTLQWERSKDNINWEPIHNANSNLYNFLPTESSYYRAANKFAYCAPTYSPVTFIQTKPIANAGKNRIANGTETLLFGNSENGASSEWTILEGENGQLESPNSATSKFIGTKGEYKLLYKLQNSCGVSNDTITVKFIENQYYNKIVYVDETDQISSTPEEQINGIYKIKFSEPIPNIDNETIIIGVQGDGFMRKINSFVKNATTYELTTSQATMEDIILDGGIEFGKLYFQDDFIMNNGKTSEYKKLSKLPTRAEILKSEDLRKGNYFFVVNESYKTDNGEILPTKKSIISKKEGEEYTLIDFNFDDTEIYNKDGVRAYIDGSLKFYPNFNGAFETSLIPFGVKKFQIGVDNAHFDFNSKIRINLETTGQTKPAEFNLFTLHKDIVLFIAGVPTYFKFKTKVGGELKLSSSGSADFEVEAIHNYYVSAGIVYENKKWDSYFSDKYTTSLKHEFSAKGSITGSIDFGPKTYVTINGLAGPYLDLKMTSDLTFCLGTQNAENLNWGINMDIGGKVTAGVHAYMFKEKLFDESVTWENRKLYNEKLPYTLGYVSGDNQQYAVGTPLESPLKVQVLSKQGRYAPNVFVTFEVMENSGVLSKTEVKTNNQGFAEVNFTPTVSGIAHVKAYVKDCDFNYLQYAPITFSAKEKMDTTAGCSQTTLFASYVVENNMMKPTVHLGQPPYEYSVNGGSYTNTVPEIPVTEKENYNIAVRDAAGCIAYSSYTDLPEYNPGSCFNSNLRIISLEENVSMITVTATGGTAPYLYSKDGVNFGATNIFSVIPNVLTTFYVKDSRGCFSTATKILSNGGNAPTNGLVAYYPFNGNANDQSGYGNHGITYGTILATDRLGNTNSAYYFDGNTNQIIIPHSNSLNLQKFTISLWAKPENNNTFGGVHYLISKGNDHSSNYGLTVYQSSANTSFKFGNYQSGWQDVSTAKNSITYNSWNHIIVTYDGSKLTIYINGAKQVEQIKNLTLFNNTENVTLGIMDEYVPGYSYNYQFKGIIDDIRIYNRALSNTEVINLYY